MLKLLALAALLAGAAAAPGDYPNIRDLQQTGSTLSSVTLSWTLDVSQFVPVTYTLVVDGILTMQFFNDGSNTYTATGLQSCKQYSFELTAGYELGSGEKASTVGSTEYEIPGAVTDLTLSGSVVSWTAPNNERCVDFYRVCYSSTVTGSSNCITELTSTSYDLGVLSGCDDLDITVEAVGGGVSGAASTVHVTTDYGIPSMVRDLEVVPQTETSVLLAWNPPLENPACVQDYAIVYGPVNDDLATEVSDEYEDSKTEDDEDNEDEEGTAEGPSGQEITAILDNLMLCTDYRFGVAAVSNTGQFSAEVRVFLSTVDSAPGAVPDIEYDQSDNSITISWGDVSREPCLDVIQICYVDPIEHTYACVEVPSSPNTWTLSGLGACREYEFRITGVSPGGLTGEPIIINVPTLDKAPGPVQNLALEEFDMTSLTVTYDAPLEDSECVEMYVVTYVNILDLETRSAETRAGSFTAYIDGLDACATYDVGVSAKSPSGIEGPVTHIEVTLKQGSPVPPTEGTLVDSTDTSLTVLWFAPTDMRFCVDFYDVKLTKAGTEHSQQVMVPQYNLQVLETFTDLDPCTSYHVEIRAGNSDTNSHSPFNTIVSDATTLC